MSADLLMFAAGWAVGVGSAVAAAWSRRTKARWPVEPDEFGLYDCPRCHDAVLNPRAHLKWCERARIAQKTSTPNKAVDYWEAHGQWGWLCHRDGAHGHGFGSQQTAEAWYQLHTQQDHQPADLTQA